MKTLKEIKDEVAHEIGYESAENYLSELYEVGSIYTIERINLFINEVAIRTAKEALKNASESAKTVTDSFPSEGSGSGHANTFYNTVIDKQSILSE